MKVVRRDHTTAKMDTTGHGFDHVLQVAQYALLIAEDETTGKLAGAAALCHDADRLLSHTGVVVSEEMVINLITGWLEESGEITFGDYEKILQVALKHNKPNLDDNDEVLIVLQDADRITCSTADNIMTAAQFWKNLPAFNPESLANEPTDPYSAPESVLHNLKCRYDWVDPTSKVCVHLPKAKALMERRVKFIKNFIAELEAQRTEAGLWPYPL